jgi:hypothetical protein
MKTIRSLIAKVVAGDTRRSAASRPRARRDPLCEVLEGRQLLSTVASSVATLMPAWGSMGAVRHASGGSPKAAEIAHFDQGGHGFHALARPNPRIATESGNRHGQDCSRTPSGGVGNESLRRVPVAAERLAHADAAEGSASLRSATAPAPSGPDLPRCPGESSPSPHAPATARSP